MYHLFYDFYQPQKRNVSQGEEAGPSFAMTTQSHERPGKQNLEKHYEKPIDDAVVALPEIPASVYVHHPEPRGDPPGYYDQETPEHYPDKSKKGKKGKKPEEVPLMEINTYSDESDSDPGYRYSDYKRPGKAPPGGGALRRGSVFDLPSRDYKSS